MAYKLIWLLRGIFYKLFWGRIGWLSYLGRPIFVLGARKIHLGDRVRIFPNSRFEVHNSGRLVIRDNVSIGQNLHIICSGTLVIESGCLISSNVLITDTEHSFSTYGTPVLGQPDLVKQTHIGKNCFIGYGVIIHAGSILEDNCIVGSNSSVKGHFGAGSIIAGSPAKVISSREREG